MSGSFSVYTEPESDDIPAQPGLYAFFLDLVGPGNCGLRAGQHVTPSNFTKIANNLDYRLRRLIPIFRQLELSGRVIQSDKFGPLQRAFDFTGKETSPSPRAVTEIAATPAELESILIASKRTAFFLPPVYVGMTVDQTLGQRYRQHHAAYQNSTELNVFGSRLRSAGLAWTDLLFACVPIGPHDANEIALRFVEQQLHVIHPPILSVK